MTIIIGAKYNDGVIIGYDTLNVKLNYKNKPTFDKEPAHKFRQVSNNSFGMGMAGLVDLDFFNDYENLLKDYNNEIYSASKKFLRQNVVDSMEAMFQRELIRNFIFASHDKLFFGCNHRYECEPKEKEFGGIGEGYKYCNDFFEKEYSSNMNLNKCVELIQSTINYATEKANNTEGNLEKGHVLDGLGIVNIEKNKYQILNFESPKNQF